MEWVKRRVNIMFFELDIDNSNSISIDEVQAVFHQVKNKDYVKETLKTIATENLFNPQIIENFDEMDAADIENLLFYECVKITPEQEEEIEILRKKNPEDTMSYSSHLTKAKNKTLSSAKKFI
jgi:hypothetical protein